MEKFIVKANDDAYVYMTIRIKKYCRNNIPQLPEKQTFHETN